MTDQLTAPPGAAETTAATLEDRLWITLAAILLVLLVTTAVISMYYLTIAQAGVEPPAGVVYGAVGLGLVVATALLWWRFGELERRVAFPLHRPGRTELAWTLVCVPLGVGAFVGGEWVAGLLGFELVAFYAYDLRDPVTLAGVVFGALVVAPLAEELLFRGALISSLEDRGWSPRVAGLGSIAVFAIYHVFALGVAGIFAIAAWAVFPTILRLRFDNVTGAWLLHLLNNTYAYVIAVLFVF